MIFESLKGDGGEAGCDDENFDYMQLLMMAVATSVDALAVGITLGVLGEGILIASVVIGCTTFLISISGVLIGHYIGGKFQKIAELAGGIVLILIGLKILLEHLEVFR